MTMIVRDSSGCDDTFTGLRMSADEFLMIEDDGNFYELIDGVVTTSPSPSPRHQVITVLLVHMISEFLDQSRVGAVFVETDVHLGQGPGGGDLVDRPELVFIRAGRLPAMRDKLIGPPELVVEVVSRGSRRFDTRTKRADYERFGVGEYWIVDPARESITFLRHDGTRFVEVQAENDRFESQAIPGFVLDLPRLRAAFQPW